LRSADRPDDDDRSSASLEGRRAGRRRPWWAAVPIALFLAACVTTWAPPPQPYHRTAPVEEAGETVGADECIACHDTVKQRSPSTAYHDDCEACHGPGELHWETEEPSAIRFPSNDDCIACHESGRKTLLSWTTSEHERSGVLCTDCHDPHDREPRNVRRSTQVENAVLRHASSTSQMCSSCHPAVAASLNLPSHHPIREGMLGCTDCHQPHAGRSRTLGARTALCTSCHQDHAGPWIYEHPPVAEDCSYCHTPHGSSADSLLESIQPGSCITCHTVAESGAVHEPWAFVSSCTDCHAAVHGSYSDPHLRE